MFSLVIRKCARASLHYVMDSESDRKQKLQNYVTAEWFYR